MATTYSTNTEIRASFTQIDNYLPHTRINGPQDGSSTPLTFIVVDCTEGFGFTGTINILDSSDNLQTLEYNKKDVANFYLTTSTSATFNDATEVTTGDYQLDHYRDLAYAWVNTMLTNPAIPTNFKKDMEIARVFYLVGMNHPDPQVRQWASQVMQDSMANIRDLTKRFPAAIRQNISFIAEEGLSEDEKDFLRNGPDSC